MPRGVKWNDQKIALLFHLRDKVKLRWKDIGERFGMSAARCCTRYNYYSAKKRIAETRSRFRADSPVAYKAFPTSAVAEPPSPPAAPKPRVVMAPALAPSEPVKRPRYFHDADADIRARIACQGLTAGFLGDPPPGRSALDQRGAGK